MRFISVREMNTRPKEIWEKVKEEELVITLNGKPIALLSAISEETLEKTLRMMRRGRALMALEEMQKKSLASGLDKMTEVEIDARIRAIRKARRK
jgi:antitoxin (DNA-binding transcriptional repressor) of toxin-antitoxin stability system